MAKNIEMNYYNGSEYEVLYPYVNLTNSTGNLNISSRTTGTLPLNRGGTGGTSATSGLYNLISGSSILTTLATGDLIPFQDVSSGNAKRISVSDLINYIDDNLNTGGIDIDSGHYIGDGNNVKKTISTYVQAYFFACFRNNSSYSVDPTRGGFDGAFIAIKGDNNNQFSFDTSEEYDGIITVNFSSSSVSWALTDIFSGAATPTGKSIFNENGITYQWMAIGYRN